MPSQGSYTPTRQLEDDGPYVMPGDSAYVAELHNSVQQLQGAHALLLGGAAPRLWGAIAGCCAAAHQPQLCTRTPSAPPGARPCHPVSMSAQLTRSPAR